MIDTRGMCARNRPCLKPEIAVVSVGSARDIPAFTFIQIQQQFDSNIIFSWCDAKLQAVAARALARALEAFVSANHKKPALCVSVLAFTFTTSFTSAVLCRWVGDTQQILCALLDRTTRCKSYNHILQCCASMRSDFCEPSAPKFGCDDLFWYSWSVINALFGQGCSFSLSLLNSSAHFLLTSDDVLSRALFSLAIVISCFRQAPFSQLLALSTSQTMFNIIDYVQHAMFNMKLFQSALDSDCFGRKAPCGRRPCLFFLLLYPISSKQNPLFYYTICL